MTILVNKIERVNTTRSDSEPSGLVICPIRGEKLPDSPAGAWKPHFATPELLSISAGLFQQSKPAKDSYKQRNAHLITISPGSIQLGTQAIHDYDRLGFKPEPGELFSIHDFEPGSKVDKKPATIYEWSRKSRANMVRKLSQLDYSTWFAGQCIPGMVTLTLPANWVDIMPDGKTAVEKLKAWKRRFEYDFGIPLSAIWKREFQRRGAPHFHLLMPIPNTLSRKGEPFKQWCARAWAEVCGATGEEFEKHLRAGTGIDFADGLRMTDPKRIAIYFLKKEAGTSGKSSKEYQHRVPKEWQGDGKRVGRFWGVWRLKPATELVELSHSDYVQLTRIMRRWSKAQQRTTTVLKLRTVINPETGEVIKTRKRRQTVRHYFFKNGAGFACVNDGANFASQLARALAVLRQ